MLAETPAADPRQEVTESHMTFRSKGALELETDARVSGRMTEAHCPYATGEARRCRPRDGGQDL